MSPITFDRQQSQMAKSDLIILHGALGGKDQFTSLASLLSENFNVFTIDFEGHGSRASQRPFSIEHFAENLAELISNEGLQNPSVFGYSMGGYVALYHAATSKQRFNGIFTLGTKFNWTPESASTEVKMLNPDKIIEKVPAFAKSLDSRHQGIGWKNVMEETASMMLEMGDNPPLNDQLLDEIHCPVLITRGDNDSMVNEEESQSIASKISGAQYHSFQGFKHPIEQVDQTILAKAINGFFNDLQD